MKQASNTLDLSGVLGWRARLIAQYHMLRIHSVGIVI